MRASVRVDPEDGLPCPLIGIGSAPDEACWVVWTIASSPGLKLRGAGALLPVSAVTGLAVSHALHSSLSEWLRISVIGHLCTVKKVFLSSCLGASGRSNHRPSQRRQVHLGESSL